MQYILDIPLSAGANSLLVPSNSIVPSTERQYVIQLIDGKTHFVDIKEEVGKLNRSDHLANERTFLAWVRTSLGIMGFGFVDC